MPKLIPVNDLKLIRIGSFPIGSIGDYLDHMIPDLCFAISDCGDENDILLIHHEKLGLKVFRDESFFYVISDVTKYLEQKYINSDLLLGLLRSTYDQDLDGLTDANPDYPNISFFANDSDDVLVSESCCYGIGSLTYDIEETFFDSENNEIISKGVKLGSLSDLYGRVDEDESWVIGIKH